MSSNHHADAGQREQSTSNSATNLISELLASSLPAASVDGAKNALSLRTTTLQFTRFVQKAGPVFAVSDRIEAILRWQDPFQTLCAGAGWAIICLFPATILLLPSIIITVILLVNHNTRFPPSSHHAVRPPVSENPPAPGSVDYLQNMQNIQELMGRVADLTDAGRNLVPYFNWSSPYTSTILLQISSLITLLLGVGLYFSTPFLDIRYVFLVLGEAGLLSTHPFSISFMNAVSASPSTKLYIQRLKAIGIQFLADDALPDQVVYPNRKGEKTIIKEILVLENERRGLDGSWSTDTLRESKGEKAWVILIDEEEQPLLSKSAKHAASAGSASSAAMVGTPSSAARNLRSSLSASMTGSSSYDDPSIASAAPSLHSITPPKGFAYLNGSAASVNEEWLIDVLGLYNAPYGVDAQGWAFWDADERPLYVDPEQKPGERAGAARRRRRWVRRIVSVPTY